MEIKKRFPNKRIKFISETVSGVKKVNKRKLGELLSEIKQNDILVISELSRLGRSLIMIMNVLQELMEKGVVVISIKEGYEFGDNIQSKVIAFAFGLSAEIERQLISERTKIGLERAKIEGKHIGRKKYQKNKKYKLSGKYNYICRCLKRGESKSNIARSLNVSRNTLYNFLKSNCSV